jgi:putative exosortase-associated protein (TIGR04073 family)
MLHSAQYEWRNIPARQSGGKTLIMTKKKGVLPVAMLLVAALVVVVLPADGQLYDPTIDLPQPTVIEKSLTKLGRGISNILFGWTEIPLSFDRNLKKGKPFTYLVTVAPVLGTAKAVIRTGTGVFEIVTFPRAGTRNYEAILEPEYLF